MLKKCVLPLAMAMVAMVTVAGCSGEKEVVDPFARVTLKQATYGPTVVSKGWKYKLVHPEIVEGVGHLLLVREGNITTLIAGRSIADKISGLDPTAITFNVVKKYTPYTHFKCEIAYAGNDTIYMPKAGSIFYPRIKDPEKFNFKRHNEVTMEKFRYNDTSGLRRMTEKRYQCAAQIEKVEEEGEEVWMLVGNRASLRIDRPDDGIEMVLRLLSAEGIEFDGGFTFDEVEEWTERQDNHVAGTVTIDFVKYQGKVFSI